MNSSGFTQVVLLSAVAACIVTAWIAAARKLYDGVPLVERADPRHRPWGLLDILFTLLLLSAGQTVVANTLRTMYQVNLRDPQDSRELLLMLLGQSIATLLTFIVSSIWLRIRYGSLRNLLGFDPEHSSQDVALGVVGFLLLSPVVYGIQLILVQWLESSHPLLELLLEGANFKIYLLCIFAAVIVAPVAEEYFFRVLLQGWLEQIARREHVGASFFWGLRRAELATPSKLRTPAWPIVVSAVVFGLAHISHGAAPISLFVFGLGLGYLYQRTQRLLPCVVVHACLNSCSLLMFALSRLAGE